MTADMNKADRTGAGGEPSGSTRATEREARRAASLRENLKRRKAGARDPMDQAAGAGAGSKAETER